MQFTITRVFQKAEMAISSNNTKAKKQNKQIEYKSDKLP